MSSTPKPAGATAPGADPRFPAAHYGHDLHPVLNFRRFRVEYSADGAPFVWEGDAVSERAAIRCAAYDLAVACPTFNGRITATAVIEVAP